MNLSGHQDNASGFYHRFFYCNDITNIHFVTYIQGNFYTFSFNFLNSFSWCSASYAEPIWHERMKCGIRHICLWGSLRQSASALRQQLPPLPPPSLRTPPLAASSCLVLPSGQQCVPTPPWGADMCERYAGTTHTSPLLPERLWPPTSASGWKVV